MTTSEEEDTEDITLKDMIGREVERIRSETPIRSQSTSGIETVPQDVTGEIRLKQNVNGESNPLDPTIEPRRTERIRTAKKNS